MFRILYVIIAYICLVHSVLHHDVPAYVNAYVVFMRMETYMTASTELLVNTEGDKNSKETENTG
jgi:hypothetical protein